MISMWKDHMAVLLAEKGPVFASVERWREKRHA